MLTIYIINKCYLSKLLQIVFGYSLQVKGMYLNRANEYSSIRRIHFH